MSLDLAITHRFPGFSLEAAFTAPNGVTALFGRSGSGKTTIANAIAGLLRPDAGRIAVEDTVLLDTAAGQHIAPHRRRIGYVFQEARLFPHLSVRRNLLYGRWFSGGGGSAGTRDDLARITDLLGLNALLDRAPGALSGGERQRVALGRALLARPRMLVMDEPLAALDEERKAEILPYLERLRDEAAVPILFVSHNLAEVARLATTLVVLDAGRVTTAGPLIDILADPDAVPALGIRDAGSVLTGRVITHHADGLSEIEVAAGRLLLPHVAAVPGAHLRIRIAAQDVILAREEPTALSALNILPARVTSVRPGNGPGVMVRLDAAGDSLLARITKRSAERLALAPGVSCYAIAKAVSVAPMDIGQS
ncbi:MAG: molybdenum ABC transporter ATP-binding protein [Pseudomonadota bacterium]